VAKKQKIKFKKQRKMMKKEIKKIRIKKPIIVELVRTVDLEVTFVCCYEGTYYPEPIPLTLHDPMETSDFWQIKSVAVWKDLYLDSASVRDYITELCNSKCRRAMHEHAEMCPDGYEVDVLDYYEE